MVTKHTPGPWVQKPARTMTHVHSVNGTMIGSLPIGWDESKGETPQKGLERKANASIFEAAPELLEALEESNNQLKLLYVYVKTVRERIFNNEQAQFMDIDAIDDIMLAGRKNDAAITKARGESQ